MPTIRSLSLRKLSTVVAGAACAFAFAASAQAQTGVNVQIGQPGFYGQIQIGNTQPQVIYQQPVIIQRPAVATPMQPVYMRVPPGHAKKWAKHCAEYNACGMPVYFVKDDWYQRTYAAAAQPGAPAHPQGMPPGLAKKMHGDDDGPGRGKGHGKH